MLWLPLEPAVNTSPFLVGVSVPKRNFPRAVDRNKLKRRLREAYRTNKDIWSGVTGTDLQYAVLFIYTAKKEETYQRIEKTMQFMLHYVLERIETPPSKVSSPK